MPKIEIAKGDITRETVDAIVNAANETLLGGGGVDGAIHRAAGPRLLEACRALPEVRPGVRCPTGEARLTPGFELSARWIIHTVGPRYRGRPDDARLLASAFRSSLALFERELVAVHGARSIALPAVSCGVYGYPLDEAARIAMDVLYERAWNVETVRFVLFNDETWRAFERAFSAAGAGDAPGTAPRGT
ncbi:MAG: O-acetyl-ADP-ribose deacetylase [Myxococcota bacterium]|nr:O-acetyl-ADP-ribose deacetylase [Myxococcota bacterium]MDW8362520.1 O-acetyl-ADP-ribose deacetylase [Myxococcales bacterium]